MDNGVFPKMNGLVPNQTRGLLDEVNGDGLAVFAELGLKGFFQAVVDDGFLAVDVDDAEGEVPVSFVGFRRGVESFFSIG